MTVDRFTADDLVRATERALTLSIPGVRLRHRSVDVRDGCLVLTFTWAEHPQTFGVRIEVPDSPEHVAWTAWGPQTMDEGADYAVYHRLLEALETGVIEKSPRAVVDGITWLDLTGSPARRCDARASTSRRSGGDAPVAGQYEESPRRRRAGSIFRPGAGAAMFRPSRDRGDR